MLLWIMACTRQEPIALPFLAFDGEHPITCGQPTPGGLTVHDLRLFVHDPRLTAADGVTVPLSLTPGPFQTDTIAMLDFEDGCTNGTPQTHTALTGTAPPGTYTALSFVLGVPLAENHANPATAEGPLSATALHWTWQGGYKFLRLDFSRDGERHRVHLGSTGCRGEIGAPEGCDRENRASVTVPLRPGGSVILDVAALTAAGGCMAGADEPGCGPVFSALGLDPASGRSLGSAVIFR
jgi:uncharacterized repeat protein (TIGR04052 family)